MKRIFISLCMICLILAVTNCSSRYTIQTETQPTQDLKAYQTIHVGWLDLNENNFETYGFKTKEEWAEVINTMNLKQLPSYFKDLIPGKTITTAKSKGEATPSGTELCIKFSDVNYNAQTSSAAQVLFGSMAGSDTLDCTIRFIDAKTKTEVYKAILSVDSKAGTGYSSMGFEGRVNNTVYNTAYFISEKLAK